MAIINGTPGDDTLNGTPGDDTISGLAGNDHIRGQGGNDTIDGGDGHDFIRGQDGDDVMLGGNDDDYLDGGDGDDLLDGGSGIDRVSYAVEALVGVTVDLNLQGAPQATGRGNDTLIGVEHLSGTRFDDTLVGDANDNWLWGGSDSSGVTGNDAISGNGGNDLITVGAGNHILSGGSGTDTLGTTNDVDISPLGMTVSLALQGAAQATGQGSWTLSGFENLSGSFQNDHLSGDGAVNVIAGALGNDILSGGGGNDMLYGDGTFTVDTHGTGGSGPIVFFADYTTFDPISFLPGDDTLDGGAGSDLLNGGGGNDTASYGSAGVAVSVNLTSGTANDGTGTDTLVSIENVTGSSFNDLIRGNAGDNVLNGKDGHDFMRGHDGNDTMIGGDGDDYLDGGLGDDMFNGGNGWDRVSYAVGATTGVTVSLAVAGPQVTGHGTDTLNGIEHLSGTKFNDTLTGNNGDNWLWGGSDSSGVTGNDIISAADGNDLVSLGAGNHLVSGGSGTDTLNIANDLDVTAAGVTVSLALQGAAQATGQGSWNLSGFENLSGSTYGDTLTGNGGDNLLAGALGNDTLNGGDGDDTLYGDGNVTVDTHGTGGSGPIVTYVDYQLFDPMFMVSGNDVLNGGKGDDVLVGGGGDDTLTGGNGKDLFLFTNGTGDDVITDMAKNDRIAIAGVAGVDDFSDLTIGSDGSGNAVVSWGTTDSVTLLGMKPKQVTASIFVFEDPTASAAAAGFALHSHQGGDILVPPEML